MGNDLIGIRTEAIQLLLAGLMTGLILGIIILDIMLPLDLAAGAFYVALVMISLWSPRFSFTLFVAAVCAVLLLLDLIYSPIEETNPMTIANRGLSLFAIWATVILAYLHKRAQQHISFLQQLLPMCAGCKKIRDDQGSWYHLEDYLKSNSNLKTSPTTCPECLKKWTPRAVGSTQS